MEYPEQPDPSIRAKKVTSVSFQIDKLSQLTVKTHKPPEKQVYSDTFSNTSGVNNFASTTITGGNLQLAGTSTHGFVMSGDIGKKVKTWNTFTASTTVSATSSLVFQFYDSTGSGHNLISDSRLQGNSTGFATTTVDLSSLNTTSTTSTIKTIQIKATFSGLPSATIKIGR